MLTGASNNVSIALFRDLKNVFVIESRDSFKNADSSSKETSEVFMSETLNHSFKLGMQRYHFFRSDQENSEYRPIPFRS